jgi:hypothetical protein
MATLDELTLTAANLRRQGDAETDPVKKAALYAKADKAQADLNAASTGGATAGYEHRAAGDPINNDGKRWHSDDDTRGK